MACRIASSFLGIMGHGAGLFHCILVGSDRVGLSQAPKHHSNVLPDCLESDLLPAGLQSAKEITCSPLLAWPSPGLQTCGGGRSPGAGAQPPTLPRRILPRVLRHSFPPIGAALAHSPTNPTPQGPHPPVVPAWYVVTICLCLIHGWGLGQASQEREELPWGLAQFLPACPRPGPEPGPGPGTGPRSCRWA